MNVLIFWFATAWNCLTQRKTCLRDYRSSLRKWFLDYLQADFDALQEFVTGLNMNLTKGTKKVIFFTFETLIKYKFGGWSSRTRNYIILHEEKDGEIIKIINFNYNMIQRIRYYRYTRTDGYVEWRHNIWRYMAEMTGWWRQNWVGLYILIDTYWSKIHLELD